MKNIQERSGRLPIFEDHHFPIEEMFYILKEMERKRGGGTWEGDRLPVLTIVKRGKGRKFGFV
jgi:hypothetical protein